MDSPPLPLKTACRWMNLELQNEGHPLILYKATAAGMWVTVLLCRNLTSSTFKMANFYPHSQQIVLQTLSALVDHQITHTFIQVVSSLILYRIRFTMKRSSAANDTLLMPPPPIPLQKKPKLQSDASCQTQQPKRLLAKLVRNGPVPISFSVNSPNPEGEHLYKLECDCEETRKSIQRCTKEIMDLLEFPSTVEAFRSTIKTSLYHPVPLLTPILHLTIRPGNVKCLMFWRM